MCYLPLQLSAYWANEVIEAATFPFAGIGNLALHLLLDYKPHKAPQYSDGHGQDSQSQRHDGLCSITAAGLPRFPIATLIGIYYATYTPI